MEQTLMYLIMLYNAAFTYTPLYEKTLPEDKREMTELLTYLDYSNEDYYPTDMLGFWDSWRYLSTPDINYELITKYAISNMEDRLSLLFIPSNIDGRKKYCQQKYNELLESIVALAMSYQITCELEHSYYNDVDILKRRNRRRLYKELKAKYEAKFKAIADRQMAQELAACEDSVDYIKYAQY